PRRLYAIVVTLGRALQRVPFLSNVTPFNVIGQLIGQLIGRLRDLVTYLSETALPALLRWTPEGYLDLTGPQPRLRPRHGTVIAATIVLLLVFAWLGGYRLWTLLGYEPQPASDQLPLLPTLLYILLLCVLSCLALTGLTFFCDRFRLPIVIPWVLLMA